MKNFAEADVCESAAADSFAVPIKLENRTVSQTITIACSLLIFYGIALFFLSQTKLLWADELLTLYTASSHSVMDVIHIQKNYPITLEPPVYQMLAHVSLGFIWNPDFAIRLPSAMGVLVFLGATFMYMRRLTGSKAAMICVGIISISLAFYYATEARCYGLLLGWWGLQLLCWQSVRREERPILLAALGLLVAISINTHYFAVLLPLPLIAAELYEFVRFRQISWKRLIAICAGYSGILLWRPFLHAASAYQTNYFGKARLSGLVNVYRETLNLMDVTHSIRLIASAIFVVCIGIGFYRLVRQRDVWESYESPEWLVLICCCLLPVPAFILARVGHTTLEPRYVLASITGYAALAAFALTKYATNRNRMTIVLSVLAIIFACKTVLQIRTNQLQTSKESNVAALEQIPSGPIAIADLGKFMALYHYAPKSIRDRIVYVYDATEELRYMHSTYAARTAMNAGNFVSFPVVEAKCFLQNNKNFTVARWSIFDAWWMHSWSDEQLTLQNTQQIGSWTLFNLAQNADHSSFISNNACR